jgi:hypothetical protein
VEGRPAQAALPAALVALDEELLDEELPDEALLDEELLDVPALESLEVVLDSLLGASLAVLLPDFSRLSVR